MKLVEIQFEEQCVGLPRRLLAFKLINILDPVYKSTELSAHVRCSITVGLHSGRKEGSFISWGPIR